MVFKCPTQLARLLRDPGGSGMLGTPREVDTAHAQFDEEEHVDRFQSQGFDGEKVTGQHLVYGRAKSSLTKND